MSGYLKTLTISVIIFSLAFEVGYIVSSFTTQKNLEFRHSFVPLND